MINQSFYERFFLDDDGHRPLVGSDVLTTPFDEITEATWVYRKQKELVLGRRAEHRAAVSQTHENGTYLANEPVPENQTPVLADIFRASVSSKRVLVELLGLYLNTDIKPKTLTEVLARARSQRRKGTRRPGAKQAQRRLEPLETAELVAAYQQGAGVKMLAARFGVHRQTVSEILRREGVALRQRGLSAEQVADARRLYVEGWSLVRLGERYGVDPTTVWRALVAADVPMRSPNERSA